MAKEKKDKKGKFFNIILDSIGEGVFTVNKNWIITSFNKAAERITGVSAKDAIGQKCFDVFHANICQTACALKKTMESGRRVIDLSINILNSQGKSIPIAISTALLRDKKGRVVGGVETFRDISEVVQLKKEISQRYTFQDIVSKNHGIQSMLNILPDIAESDSTVLIQGPSGSGKELFARAIHHLSHRSKKPYVVVNCGALPDTLLESELFGYVKGAFTDAKKDKPGRFALAEKGTVFLDEIGDIPLPLQAKMLRVLEEREYEPLGGTSPIKANVRIIAATNKDLAEMVKKGNFREDLYYRINVVKIDLPSLLERREDIPLLIDHFIQKFNLKRKKNIVGISNDVLDLLMRYDFSGNIRELENIIEHAFVLCRSSIIDLESLPKELVEKYKEKKPPTTSQKDQFQQAEAQVIIDALKRNNGNRTKAAKELGIDKSTLWRKMKRYKIKG